MNWHAIEPLDVLFLRGNRLFGDPGSYGEALVPPWPSAAAGALRSAILVRDGVDPATFAKGEVKHATLGKPDAPGPFSVTGFHLARRNGEAWEILFPQPSDLVVSRDEGERIVVHRLHPHALEHGLQSSLATAKLPVLTQARRTKPDSGWWLAETGWAAWLSGEVPTPKQLVDTGALWRWDERVGVGLEAERRQAEDGRLFTVQAVAFREGVGFLAATAGDALGKETLLRLGGDGRGAIARPVDYRPPRADLAAIAEAGRARIVLTSPGIFEAGWRLPGMAEDGRFELGGVRGRIVAAAVGRAEVVSGWDLARWRPKDACRAAPAGSVYWLEELEATPEALGKLAGRGLWPESGYDVHRRVEGFNRFDFAVY